ncbi:hypothetical protein EDB81DRAFT_437310 [Dactylonectria macrodidyma]|uniref:Uncharacterized protein n=1 Tax=Dactylonectria macrodidyma TaxID=307937 RepID=A0A9P9F4Z4_9HYPO|nr:hypothetical protein EDB81DRAFT_437310 [Dactylonectria macrodidyma]
MRSTPPSHANSIHAHQHTDTKPMDSWNDGTHSGLRNPLVQHRLFRSRTGRVSNRLPCSHVPCRTFLLALLHVAFLSGSVKASVNRSVAETTFVTQLNQSLQQSHHQTAIASANYVMNSCQLHGPAANLLHDAIMAPHLLVSPRVQPSGPRVGLIATVPNWANDLL